MLSTARVSDKTSNAIWGLIIAIAVGGGVAFYQYRKKQAEREERNAPSRRYEELERSHAPMILQIQTIARDMCRCAESATNECVRSVQGEYTVWARKMGSVEVPDDWADIVATASKQYDECLGRVRAK